MVEWTVFTLVMVGSILIGSQIHERYHYWAGRILGADPRYGGKFAPVFPTRTRFQNYKTLSNREIRIIGIPGHISFLILVFLAILPRFPTSLVEIAVVGVAAGGGIISWTDDMAARDPQTWVEFINRTESQE